MVTNYNSIVEYLEQHAQNQQQADLADPIFPQQQVAEYLGVSRSTMCRWRRQGIGPEGHRIGGRIKYRMSAIQTFVEKSRLSNMTNGGSDV